MDRFRDTGCAALQLAYFQTARLTWLRNGNSTRLLSKGFQLGHISRGGYVMGHSGAIGAI